MATTKPKDPVQSCPFQPLGDRVVVKRDEAPTQIGSIILPENAKEKPRQGTVVAVGPGRLVNGQREPMNVQAGDKVLFTTYAGNEVKLDGQEYLILSEQELLGIVT